MKIIYLLIVLLSFNNIYAQDRRFSIEVNYGLAGNYFVTSYIEDPSEGYLPPGFILLADKDYLGTVSQIQLNYELKNNSSFALGYSRDAHQSERNYSFRNQNSLVIIRNWAIRHNNNIYFLKYQRNIKDPFKYHFGIFYLRPEQQEIEVWEQNTGVIVILDERDTPNNRLNEAGIFGGLDYEKQIDTRFKAGIHLSAYYLASADTYETTYLTGSISYMFGRVLD